MICLNLKSIESVVVEKMTRMWLYLGISGPRPALDHARVTRVTYFDMTNIAGLLNFGDPYKESRHALDYAAQRTSLEPEDAAFEIQVQVCYCSLNSMLHA